jgi:hypothetical protein
VTLRQLGAAVSTVNRRIAGVRAFFEYLVMTEVREDNPVPAPRRGQGLRPAVRGLLRPSGSGPSPSRLAAVLQPRRLPESLPGGEIDAPVPSLRPALCSGRSWVPPYRTAPSHRRPESASFQGRWRPRERYRRFHDPARACVLGGRYPLASRCRCWLPSRRSASRRNDGGPAVRSRQRQGQRRLNSACGLARRPLLSFDPARLVLSWVC